MLPTRRLGKTGLDVSVLGWGGAPASFLKTDQDEAATLVNALLDAGVNLIDQATAYPGGHKFVGDHLASRRDDFTLVSKVGAPDQADKFDPDRLKKQVDAALAACKTDRIDVMLLHTPPLDVLEADDALGALIDCRDAGKVLHVGLSGDNETAALACRMPDVAVIECSVNVADQANIADVLPLAVKHDVGVIAKRPLANAAWKDIGDQRGLYKSYAKTYTDRLAKMAVDPAAFGLDWPTLALRFTLSHPGVTTAIVGTTNPANAAANLQAAADPSLADDAASTLAAAFAAAQGEEAWAGLT